MVMLAVCAVVVYAASLDGAAGKNPPAGVYGTDDSGAARRVMEYLTENGFVRYDDPEKMVSLVEQGELDCAVILPYDLLRRMEQGDMEGCVEFITGPLSFMPQLYQNHVSGAVFREYAPYISAHTLTDTEIPADEIVEEYERMFEKGYVFSFELVGAGGVVVETDGRRELVMGAVALLVFALLVSAGVDGFGRDLILRLGLRRALTNIALPGVLVRAVFSTVACGTALMLADAADLIGPLAVYVLVLGALNVFLAAVLPDERDRYILLTVVLILSLALCPIYVDITLFSPLLRSVRYLLPPYWFYLAEQATSAWLVGGIAAMLAACGAIFVRASFLEQLQIK